MYSVDIIFPMYMRAEPAFDDKWFAEDTLRLLIENQKGLPFVVFGAEFFPDISVIKNKKVKVRLINKMNVREYMKQHPHDFELVKVRFVFTDRTLKTEKELKKIPFEESQKFYPTSIFWHLHDYIDLFFVMLNIARPGSLTTECYIYSENGDLKNIDSKISDFSGETLAYLLSNQMSKGWPNIETLDIVESWQWFLNNKNIFYDAGTSLSMAISAFSRVLSKESQRLEEVSLLWSMYGLEALFCSDSQNEDSLMSQIRFKTESILGECKEYKHIIRDMYKIRSKFIHGRIGPSLLVGNIYQEDKMLERFNSPVYNAAGVAASILLASIQFAIKRGWNNIAFKRTFTVSEN